MAAFTSLETRLGIELQRRYLLEPGPMPAEIAGDIGDCPPLLVKQRWAVTRAPTSSR